MDNWKSRWASLGYDWVERAERETAFTNELSETKDFDEKVSISTRYFKLEYAIALASGIDPDDENLHSPEFLLRMQIEAI